MKYIRYFFYFLIVFLIAASVFLYFFLKGTKPVYNEELTVDGITNEVKVYYDDYGIPHIYASNEEDAYYALGYVYAKDRLFQTELLKRLAQGRLSELLGKDLVKVDKYMRTLGLREAAKKSAAKYMNETKKQYQKDYYAYLKGFNTFLEKGNMPVEYKLLNIPKEKLQVEDPYSIVNLIALGFSMPVIQESISAYIYKKYGKSYLDDLYFGEKDRQYRYYEVADTNLLKAQIGLNYDVLKKMDEYGLNVWEGSNSWVISAKRSKSGKPILANDTHFAYSQPAVWYEAEITYPGYNFYGFYLPGLAFPVIGHSHHHAWGLTIFPLDNSNFYEETIDSTHKKVLYKNQWVDLQIIKDTIKVKDSADVIFDIVKTPHGPIMNNVDKKIGEFFDKDVSLWWVLQKMKTGQIEALYNLANAGNMDEFESTLDKIDILGLNVMYADDKDNIAWWGTGKIPVYNENINPFVLLKGDDGSMEIDSFYPFSENPHLVNPPAGYIATANNDPVLSGYDKYFPGHYLPTNRIEIINKSFANKKMWDVEDSKKLQLNQESVRDFRLKEMIIKEMQGYETGAGTSLQSQCLEQLKNWDGEYSRDSKAAVIFTKLQYYIIYYAMQDELGKKMFDHLTKTYLLKSSVQRLFLNPSSPWWDDIMTKDKKETRKQIIRKAFASTVKKLKEEWGADINKWRWEDAHVLTFHHPFSKKKPLNKIFDVGPFKMPSCPGCLNKMSFHINNDKVHQINGGPALRIIIDFADVENALNVIPTGQSGNIMSKHYDDQAQLFTTGKYRKMIMNDTSVIKAKDKIVLLPDKEMRE